MKEKKPGKTERFLRFMGSKGFYIVLFLCISVIGISAWVLTYTMNRTGLDLSESLNETLNARVTANLPSPTVPVMVTIAPSAESVLPPSTAKPEQGTGSVWDSSDIVTYEAEEDYEDYDTYSEYGYEDSYYEAEAVLAPTLFVWPIAGNVETPHSVETLVYSRTLADWRTHNGIDIAASMGAKVTAVAGGTVESVYNDRFLGTTVVINHGGGLRSLYANLAELPPVTVGNYVEIGEVVGSVGQTAIAEAGDVTHLHLEMTSSGEQVDPLDYLPRR